MPFTRLVTLGCGLLMALAILAASLNPAASPPSEAASAVSVTGLHASGNQILNGAGQALLLHGVNRSSAEYACVEGYGIWDGPANDAEVQAMLTWNINVVRVVLNEDCWLGIKGVSPAYSGANYQNAIANYVSLLTQANIVTIINLHFNAPGSSRATGQQPMPDRDYSPAFWSSVANRFKSNSAVLFEPYNEPYPDNGRDTAEAWRCWRDGGSCQGVSFTAAGMQELVTAIRNTGATNPIILTGNNWGSQLTRWVEYLPNDPLRQLIAGWHSYGDGLDCQNPTCWNTVLVGVLSHAPILATEIGQFDCRHDYVDQVMDFLDSKGQGYMAWSWGPFSCSSDPALLTDWSGTPSQTYGSGFRTHILQVPNPRPATGATSTPATTATQTHTATRTSTPGGAASTVPTATGAPATIATETRTATRTSTPGGAATTVPTATGTPATVATETRTTTRTSTPVSGSTSYRGAVLADDPVAYWRLNETSGATAADLRLVHPGSYVSGPLLGQPGALDGDSDQAARFYRNDRQYVRVPNSPALNTTVFSAEAWAFPTGGDGDYRAVMGSRDYPRGWVLYASQSNVWEFWVNNGAGIVSVSGGPLALNTWTHLVATFDGATARLYVNGTLAGSTAVPSGYSPQTSNPLMIGLTEPGTRFWFDGRLDEAAVYSRALSAAQVLNHYRAGRTG